MANRSRYLLKALTRQATTFLFRNTHPSLQSLSFSSHFPNPSTSLPIFTKPLSAFAQCSNSRHFSSDKTSNHSNKVEDRSDQEEEDEDEEDFEDEEDYESGEEGEGYDDENASVSSRKKVYTEEEKEAEALDIGYKVVGPLHNDDRVFKPYEPVFAVVQIGSHQFKVSNRDSIFTERLKFCEVNDKLILNKVLLVGSDSQTIVGRPTVPGAAVHAVVEEHALDAKVIIFKKKRRKNYRRTRGHRQELTKLRITNIEGIEKPQNVVVEKPSKAAKGEQNKVPVTA
ncbi:hypothetical protein TanjilG_24416 [Lupinus angustifolius]|uniref:Large ribosomal subunit protein bL21m n=1 Tax=Lupinus angustifolius TaxID=3871 RepID=A0A1J7GFM8_LUPAN|nr:PREDICTED: 50S ribosomal protein L21, mitochondrial-like [Lupinus angustifolius]OIV93201.1 hypothetical protein TanjilG_24416 [Lupinus angustifolius]